MNGPPSHVTLPFEYQTPILSDIQMNSVFRWLLYLFCKVSDCGTVSWNSVDADHFQAPFLNYGTTELNEKGNVFVAGFLRSGALLNGYTWNIKNNMSTLYLKIIDKLLTRIWVHPESK